MGVQLQEAVRIAAMVLTGLGVTLIGTGIGGIRGLYCAYSPADLKKLTAQTMDKGAFLEIELAKVQPSPHFGVWGDCSTPERTITLVKDYVTLDQFMWTPRTGEGEGLLSQYERKFSRRRWQYRHRFYEARSLGPDNIIFVNSLGIRMAFFVACFTFVLAIVVVLSDRGLILKDNIDVLLIERILIFICAVLNFAAGVTAGTWGRFSHLSAEQLRQSGMKDLGCLGWALGGVFLLVTACFQAIDFVLAILALIQRRRRGGRPHQANESAVKRLVNRWETRRLEPSRATSCYSKPRHTAATTASAYTGDATTPDHGPTYDRGGPSVPGTTAGTRPPADHRVGVQRTVTNVQSKANQASMPSN